MAKHEIDGENGEQDMPAEAYLGGLLLIGIFFIFVCWALGKGFERFVDAIYGNDQPTINNTVIINPQTYTDTVRIEVFDTTRITEKRTYIDTVTMVRTEKRVVIDTLYKIERY